MKVAHHGKEPSKNIVTLVLHEGGLERNRIELIATEVAEYARAKFDRIRVFSGQEPADVCFYKLPGGES